jgi:hypothetical protein
MFSRTSGRPKGTQNRPGHSAGGSRIGAGRKKKARVDSPEMSSTDEDIGNVVSGPSSSVSGECPLWVFFYIYVQA